MDGHFSAIELDNGIGILEETAVLRGNSEVFTHTSLGFCLDQHGRLELGHVQPRGHLHEFGSDLAIAIGELGSLASEVPGRYHLVLVRIENEVEERDGVQPKKSNHGLVAQCLDTENLWEFIGIPLPAASEAIAQHSAPGGQDPAMDGYLELGRGCRACFCFLWCFLVCSLGLV